MARKNVSIEVSTQYPGDHYDKYNVIDNKAETDPERCHCCFISKEEGND